jgi:hypothetical protein
MAARTQTGVSFFRAQDRDLYFRPKEKLIWISERGAAMDSVTDSKAGKGSALIARIRQYFRNLHQASTTALVRNPGERMFGAPVDVRIEADKHWEYALLSQLVYDKAETHKCSVRKGVPVALDYSTRPFDPRDVLAAAGWELCSQFPGDAIAHSLARTHLRVEVWRKREPAEIAVVFAGTVATNIMDWISNLRWFLPKHRDEYTELVSAFIPQFMRIYSDSYPDEPPVIHATGHSLGGGLAQQFAYALPDEIKIERPKVIQVFAFDPSPVTGYFSLKKPIRERNTAGMRSIGFSSAARFSRRRARWSR